MPSPDALDRLRPPLEACARGDLAANMALMQMAIVARTRSEIDQALARVIRRLRASRDLAGCRRVSQTLDLWRQTPQAFDTIKLVIGAAQHAAGGHAAHWADVFDRLADVSPEAAVALYSLGRADILETATASIVGQVRRWGLVAQDTVMLDLGCGCGRLLKAMAPHVRRAVGLDIAGRMLHLAQAQCRALSNVALVQGGGGDLRMFSDETFDLICAVDVFPYLATTSPGAAALAIREARRILRPGGSLLILNYSYGGDPEADVAEVGRLAAEGGWTAVRLGTNDFDCWDGRTFHLRRSR